MSDTDILSDAEIEGLKQVAGEWGHRDKYWSDVLALIRTVRHWQARAEAAEAQVRHLPKTADDVPIVPGMIVYHPDGHERHVIAVGRDSFTSPYQQVFGGSTAKFSPEGFFATAPRPTRITGG